MQSSSCFTLFLNSIQCKLQLETFHNKLKMSDGQFGYGQILEIRYSDECKYVLFFQDSL